VSETIPGVYWLDREGRPTLVHAYQDGDYALEDVHEYFGLGRLEAPPLGHDALLVLDAAELRELKVQADAYSFDYEEAFVEMCLEMHRLGEAKAEFPARFASRE